ncbi:hypothetical protein D3C79_972740 [compost metagenome]
MAKTTAKPAPALMPKIPGEANGFFVKVCISTPVIANEAPTQLAIRALGIRTF